MPKLRNGSYFPGFQRRDQAAHRGGRRLSQEVAITRLVRAILLAQNDEWAVQQVRYMTPE